MNRKFAVVLLALTALLAVPFAIGAQNATPELIPATVSDLINDPDLYTGKMVILEDAISEYINPQSFLLGADAAIGEARVLIVNTSGEPLPFTMFAGDRVVVTGVVHPSLQARVDNGEVTLPENRLAFRQGYTRDGMMVDPVDTTVEAMATADMTATVEPAATVDATATTAPMATVESATDVDPVVHSGNWEALDFYYGGGFPMRLDGYLVIEVTSIKDLSHLVAEE